jgi:hypothetical protein
MRLPLNKVYRAFPELDRFTDEQCEGFVKTAEKAERGKSRLLTVSLIPFCIVGIAGTLVLVGVVSAAIGDRPDADTALVVLGALALFVGLLWPPITWLVVRDKWLRGAIGRRIKHCTCLRCHYSLLGLPVANGKVVCPECGATHALADMGLTATDILAPP